MYTHSAFEGSLIDPCIGRAINHTDGQLVQQHIHLQRASLGPSYSHMHANAHWNMLQITMLHTYVDRDLAKQ